MNIKTKKRIWIILLAVAFGFFIAQLVFLNMRTYAYNDPVDLLIQKKETFCGLAWKVVLLVDIWVGVSIRKHRKDGNAKEQGETK